MEMFYSKWLQDLLLKFFKEIPIKPQNKTNKENPKENNVKQLRKQSNLLTETQINDTS